MKKVLLTTCNAKYIHKNLALRWLYTTCPHRERVTIREYTIKEREEQIASDILSMEVDVVCFSCYIWNIQQIKTIIQLLKQHDPLLHIVVGGPEVSYESYRLLDEGVDAISIGEGEQSIWEYITMLEEGQPHEVAGIYTKQFPNTEYQRCDLSWKALTIRILWKWISKLWEGSISIWKQAGAVHTAVPTVCPQPIVRYVCFPWTILWAFSGS